MAVRLGPSVELGSVPADQGAAEQGRFIRNRSRKVKDFLGRQFDELQRMNPKARKQ